MTMTGPICTVLTGCVCGMLFCISSARAASTLMPGSGHIIFSGAVIEPTCGAGSEFAAVIPSDLPGTKVRTACASAGAALAMPQVYALEVQSLASVAHDHLLDYFASYANATGGANGAKVMTRTYQ